MIIAVILRLVPDANGDLEIADSGTEIDREWIDLVLNEFDDQALEEAVLLKEATGAKVITLALAGEGVDRLLQTALARGADEACKIDHELGDAVSSRAAAPLLAAAIRGLGAELVMTGVQTSEDLFGQLVPYLGASLDWPHLSAVGGVSLIEGALKARQEQSGGRLVEYRISLPAVLGVQTASQPPRYVSGTKLRQAASLQLKTLPAEGDALTNPGQIVALARPTRQGSAKMLEGSPAQIAQGIVDVLRQSALAKG
jgi:electron transfer flavoprotein beta subunit